MTPQNAASHLGLFCLHKENSSKIKIIPDFPQNESGIFQTIAMGKSVHYIWVKQDPT